MANITNEQELRDAIAAKDPQITVLNDISLTQANTINYNLTLDSDNATLSWGGAANRTMFSVTGGATFTVANIILDGLGKYATLVSTVASTFIMNDGAVLKNVQTNSANNAVKIGNISNLALGGTFIMNGGLITGVMLDAVVNCSGGSIEMNGTASISQNQAYGISIQEGSLRMSGSAKISKNTADRTGMGVLAVSSTIDMGLAEGDTPQISDNTSTNSYAGGVYLASGSTLNMNYGATISGNTALNLAGGVGMSGSVLNMYGNSSISGNTAQKGGGGGIFASAASAVNITDNAAVTGNSVTTTGGRGGGIYLQQADTTLTLGGSAVVANNTADNGGGIYVNTDAVMAMGSSTTDTPVVKENSAVVSGGGIYIQTGGTANLSGKSAVLQNTAGENGAGIYNAGTFNITQETQIADGLYFNDIVNAPSITDTLTEKAFVQLEASDYVAHGNIPVVVATKGSAYSELCATDCGAHAAPASFPTGTPVYLNADKTQVLLGLVAPIGSATIRIIRLK